MATRTPSTAKTRASTATGRSAPARKSANKAGSKTIRPASVQADAAATLVTAPVPALAQPAVPTATAAPSPKSLKKVKAPKPAKAEKAAVPAKAKKPKLVRDSFTIPKDEYEMIASLKDRAADLARSPKKSELLRAGLKALAAMTDQAFLASLAAVPPVKTGRPAA